MSAHSQARALMIRHRQVAKNRQQSMLNRAAAEIGMETKNNDYWTQIQGKPYADFRETYSRSGATMS